jgi:cell wall-associated NlpC family hydrolase
MVSNSRGRRTSFRPRSPPASLMPSLRRLLVFLLAFAAMLAGTARETGENAQAAALGHPKPGHRPPRRVQPKLSLGQRVVKIALGEVGVPYRWGGESPSGFDCSGLVRWSYLRIGIDLPHSSYALSAVGRHVSPGHMKPGDVLLFDGLGHVGLYIGGGRMVHAPYSGHDVEVVPLAGWYGSRFEGARRVVSA